MLQSLDLAEVWDDYKVKGLLQLQYLIIKALTNSFSTKNDGCFYSFQVLLKEGILLKLSRKVMQPRMFFLVSGFLVILILNNWVFYLFI